MNINEQMKQRVHDIINRKARTISLELTTFCPLKCKYCKRSEIVGGRNDKKMDWDTFLKLKDRLGEFERIMICGLGETMTYDKIYDVVDQLDQKFILVTSGTMAIDYKRLNRKKNIETVVFSLDAPTEEEMVEITGNYKWENLMHNFTRNRYNRSIYFSVNCTIFESNYKRIPDMVRFAVENKLTNVNFNNAMQGADNVELKERVYRVLQQAEAIAKKKGLIITHSFRQLSCVAFGRPVPFITLNGDVYPCCYGMDKRTKMGNIYESTFTEMWESKAYDTLKCGDLCFKESCPLFKDLVLGKKLETAKPTLN